MTQSGIPKPMRYYTRKINHPKFKNTSGQGALSYLEDKEIGDVRIYTMYHPLNLMLVCGETQLKKYGSFDSHLEIL